MSALVSSRRIVELPLNARQVTRPITLSGVAVQTAASPGYTMNTGVRISVAGGNDFQVSYSLDGAPHLNNFDGTGMHLPFPTRCRSSGWSRVVRKQAALFAPAPP